MYDELVKRLREADEKSMCGECGLNLHTGATKKGVLFAEAADAIEELQGKYYLMKKTAEWLAEKVPKWIPVTEEPPLKVGDDGYNGYLVYSDGYYEVADYTTDKFDNVPYFHVYGEYETDVTHWMPLPGPPTAEEGE